MNKIKNTELIYGIHAVNGVLLNKPERILKLIVSENRRDSRLTELLEKANKQHIEVELKDKASLSQLVPDVVHQGVVAKCLVEQSALTESDIDPFLDELDEPPFLLVLDGIQDPHNLGACLRTADAAGVHAIIVPKDRAASLTATARKIATGAADSVPLIRVTNLARTLRALKKRGVWVFGLDERAETTIHEGNLTGPLALVLGAEGAGLRRLTKEHCDIMFSIPMAGTVSSLNVSVAVGICLYEAIRQRNYNS